MNSSAKTKSRKTIGAKIIRGAKIAIAAKPEKMVPGKSLEQIRIEAIRKLREIGVFI